MPPAVVGRDRRDAAVAGGGGARAAAVPARERGRPVLTSSVPVCAHTRTHTRTNVRSYALQARMAACCMTHSVCSCRRVCVCVFGRLVCVCVCVCMYTPAHPSRFCTAQTHTQLAIHQTHPPPTQPHSHRRPPHRPPPPAAATLPDLSPAHSNPYPYPNPNTRPPRPPRPARPAIAAHQPGSVQNRGPVCQFVRLCEVCECLE